VVVEVECNGCLWLEWSCAEVPDSAALNEDP